MGRERGGGVTRPARRGTRATASGGSPASWDSTTGPRPGLAPRPAPGVPQPHEHTCKDHGAPHGFRKLNNLDFPAPPWRNPGQFFSDRTIQEYARDVCGAEPCSVKRL